MRYHFFVYLIVYIPQFLLSIERRDSLPVFFYASNEIDSIKIDTSLNQFQRYTFRNTIGSIGLPETQWLISIQDHPVGFKYSNDKFQGYYFNKNAEKFYLTLKPYTDVSLFLGQKREQVFRLIHTQNVTRRLNFSVNFNRTRFDGWYLRQNVNHNNASLASNYIGKKGNYLLFFSGIYNYLQCAENGGLFNDSLFENIDVTDKKLLPVNLSQAQRRIQKNILFARQSFFLGVNDSIAKSSSGFCISHSISLENNRFVYSDANPVSGYYYSIFEDSVNTLDSVRYQLIENTLSFDFLSKKYSGIKRKIKGSAIFRYQYTDMRSKTGFMDSIMNNIIAGIAVDNKIGFKRITYDLFSEYVLNGSNVGDYRASGGLMFSSADSSNIFSLFLYTDKKAPDFIYEKYFSNHLIWSNLFDKTGVSFQKLAVALKKYRLESSITFYQYSKYLYFDNSVLPRQLSDNISLIAVSLEKNFKLKNWIFNNKATYQYVPDSIAIRFPTIVSVHSFYYENNLFKNALLVQLGVDVFYFSSYLAHKYSPVLSQFYIQNEKRIGNYPYVDMFLNMKIKNARIFVKMEHINSGLMGQIYYAAPGMPYYDRAFKIGINWKFYD